MTSVLQDLSRFHGLPSLGTQFPQYHKFSNHVFGKWALLLWCCILTIVCLQTQPTSFMKQRGVLQLYWVRKILMCSSGKWLHHRRNVCTCSAWYMVRAMRLRMAQPYIAVCVCRSDESLQQAAHMLEEAVSTAVGSAFSSTTGDCSLVGVAYSC